MTSNSRGPTPRTWRRGGPLLALVCGILAAFGISRDRAVRADRSVAEIRQRGGQVEREGNHAGGRVVGICLFGAAVGDTDMASLDGMADLRRLDLALTRVTDDGLKHLAGLTGLRNLDLFGTRITDAGLAHLRPLTGIEFLILDSTRVNDAGLIHLTGLTHLRMLGLSGLEVTDGGLAHLEGLAELQALSLLGTGVTDAGLAHLRGLTRLRALDVSRTRVTDAGIGALHEALPGLTIVHSSSSEIPDRPGHVPDLPDAMALDPVEASSVSRAP